MFCLLLSRTKGVALVPRSLISTCFRNIHNNAKITATPRVALNDVIPRIRAQGLTPKTAVTFRAQVFDDKGIEYLSNAHYVTDEDGGVDVITSSSVGGSYEGIFPTGLISSLQIVHDEFRYRRMAHDDVTQPLLIKISLFEGHQLLHINHDSLDHINLERHFLSPGVRRIEVRDGRVRGVLFIPAGEGVFPGVISMYGASGILGENRGALLASRGIACFCLAYCSYEDIPITQIYNMDIEYFEEATEYLTSRDNVIPDRCGVFGNCYGGTLGSMMAIHIDKLKATFGINFFLKHFSLNCKGKEMYHTDGNKFVPTVDECFQLLEGSKDIFKTSDTIIKNNTSPEGTFVPSLPKVSKEKYFSFAFGEDDTYETTKCAKGIKEAVGNDFETNFEVKTYPSAGHIVEPPYTIPVQESFFNVFDKKTKKVQKIKTYLGGTPKGVSEMQEDTWQNAQKFFNYHIRDNSLWYQNWLRSSTKK